MKGEKINCGSVRRIKHLHIDLTGSGAGSELSGLVSRLDGSITPRLTDMGMTIAKQADYEQKLRELLGEKQNFRIAQFAEGYGLKDSALVADDIVHRLEHTGIRSTRDGDLRTVTIHPFGEMISYENNGLIVGGLAQGRDVLHYMACVVRQDMAVVLKKDGRLIYSFDSSMFEKTPKDPVTGENRFLGQDILEFHGKAKTFGQMLPSLLDKLASSLGEHRLDLLTIDLRGGNIYSDGHQQVRRFERDYAVSLGDNRGLLAYADVFFQDIAETRSPFKGGSSIDTADFHSRFRVI